MTTRMLFSIAMSFPNTHLVSILPRALIGAVMLCASVAMLGCKRSEPPPDIIKTQREAMERAKEVGKTMQKSVDEQGKKADEEGR